MIELFFSAKTFVGKCAITLVQSECHNLRIHNVLFGGKYNFFYFMRCLNMTILAGWISQCFWLHDILTDDVKVHRCLHSYSLSEVHWGIAGSMEDLLCPWGTPAFMCAHMYSIFTLWQTCVDLDTSGTLPFMKIWVEDGTYWFNQVWS